MSPARVARSFAPALSLVTAFAFAACSQDRGPVEPIASALSSRGGGAGKALEGRALPFHGSMETVEKSPFSDPGTVISTDIGAGVASHLGAFTWYSAFVIEGDFATGNAILTAANGDKLFSTLSGVGQLAPGGFSIVETNTISGGTGRFAGATGTFTVERFVNIATNVSTGTFTGTITLDR